MQMLSLIDRWAKDPEGFVVIKKVQNGGKGSGNFGHSGRPGEVGGSSRAKVKLMPSAENYFEEHPEAQKRFDKVVKDFEKIGLKRGFTFTVNPFDVATESEQNDYFAVFRYSGRTRTDTAEGESLVYVSSKTFEKEGQKGKWSKEGNPYTADSTFEGTLRHELGHLFTTQLFLQEYKPKGELNKAEYNRFNGKLLDESGAKKPFFQGGKWSSYAWMNDSETIAEAFSNPDFSEDAKKVYDYVKNYKPKAKTAEKKTYNTVEKRYFYPCVGYPANEEVLKQMMEEYTPDRVVNGGKGSGNFGHSGRPGMVGGSSKDGQGAGLIDKYPEVIRSAQRLVVKRPDEIDDDYLLKVEAERKRLFELYGADKEKADMQLWDWNGGAYMGDWENQKKEVFSDIDIALSKAIVEESKDDRDVYRIQIDSEYNGEMRPTKFASWTPVLAEAYRFGRFMGGSDSRFDLFRTKVSPSNVVIVPDVMYAKSGLYPVNQYEYVLSNEKPLEAYKSGMTRRQISEEYERIRNSIVVQNGGKGSGNFGHSGRRGEVGGSAPKDFVASFRQMSINEQAKKLGQIWKANNSPDNLNKENLFQQASYALGNNKKPTVLKNSDFDKEPGEPLYRLVHDNLAAKMTAQEVADNLKYGEDTYQGEGDYTSGIFFTDYRDHIEEYAETENVVRIVAKLKPEAKVLEPTNGPQPQEVVDRIVAFKKMAKQIGLELPQSEAQAIAAFAAGYDALRYKYDEKNTFTAVYDRGKLLIREDYDK